MYIKKINQKAFTLIELLIAIVIIAILAGILITVIDPVAQRQRAQDGTIVASVNKIVTTLNAYYNATGVYPTCAILTGEELGNVADVTCTDASTPPIGTFTISGVNFSTNLCAASPNFVDAGYSECRIRYVYSNIDNPPFASISVRLHRGSDVDRDGDVNNYVRWDSIAGRIRDHGDPCPANDVACDD